MKMREIKFILNGKPYELKVKPWQTLLELIREDLHLTGTKEGCGQGECGSCTVIMNGKTVNSCLVPATEADGQEIITIEGLSDNEKLHPIQEAFFMHSGMQCGFCTPGMIMSAKALLDNNPDHSHYHCIGKPISPFGSSAAWIVPNDASYFLTLSCRAFIILFIWPGLMITREVTAPFGGTTIMKSIINSSLVCATIILFA
jgi:carbon-monoxide dehydrogenase small subunit